MRIIEEIEAKGAAGQGWVECPCCGDDGRPDQMVAFLRHFAADVATTRREEIIDVIANVPVTVTFTEPATEIDVWRYHADVIKAIRRAFP